MVSLVYHEVLGLLPVVYEQIIDCHFHRAGCKVAKTSRLLGISRLTVLK